MGFKPNFVCWFIIGLIFLAVPLQTHHSACLDVTPTNENQDSLPKKAPTTTPSVSFSDIDWSYKSRDYDMWREVTTPDLTGDHIVLQAQSNE
ncbi:MAG: hypothetical protein ACFFEK_11695, partial [Candidatus Thorarchaeota archaeon]